MHGLERIAKDRTNLCDFVRRESASSPNFLFERLAFNQLHPQASLAIHAIGTMNRHDVCVSDSAEEMALSDQRRRLRFDCVSRSQQLQSDISAKARVTSAINVSARTRSD